MTRQRTKQPDFLTNLVLLLGRAVWWLVSWPFRRWLGRRPTRLDQAYFAGHWETIDGNLRTGDAQQLTQAVLEGDKLFDQAMRQLGLPGEKLADRLRAAEPRFSQETYQGIWAAHKLRNQLAHEVGHLITERQAREAISYFKRGLQSLGAL